MPVAPIDLRPFREGSASQRRAVAAAFDRAGCESGFFAVTGHGVDPGCSTPCSTSPALLRPPIEDKLAHLVEDRAANRGYAAEGTEALAYSLGERDLPPDLFEAFNVGRELTARPVLDPYFATHRDRYFAANVWPTVPAGFRSRGWRTGTRSRRWRSRS